ncbi:MAG: hypothetical protein LBB72_06675 [Spirochaetaceae bacterium]|nr:hypothetical protein [Spirochaetaceae bacterium]
MRSKNDKSIIGRMPIMDETPGYYCEWVKGRSFRVMRVYLRLRAGIC